MPPTQNNCFISRHIIGKKREEIFFKFRVRFYTRHLFMILGLSSDEFIRIRSNFDFSNLTCWIRNLNLVEFDQFKQIRPNSTNFDCQILGIELFELKFDQIRHFCALKSHFFVLQNDKNSYFLINLIAFCLKMSFIWSNMK